MATITEEFVNDLIANGEGDKLLERVAEMQARAEYKGESKRASNLQQLSDSYKRAVKDESSMLGELRAWNRKVGDMALLGYMDDEKWAKLRSLDPVFGKSYEEELASVRADSREFANNEMAQLSAALLGGGAASVGIGTGVGALSSRVLPQVGAFALEGMVVTANELDASIDSNKDIVEVVNAGIIGGVFGAIPGVVSAARAKDWGSTYSSRQFRSTKDGAKTVVDDLADESLEDITVAASEAQPMVAEATEAARVQRARVNERIEQRSPQYSELGERPMYSELDDKPFAEPTRPIEQRKSWRDATNAGELVDNLWGGVRETYRDWANPLFFKLADKVSPDVGFRYQTAEQRALMNLTKEIKLVVEPMEEVFELNRTNNQFQELLIDWAADSNSVTRAELIGFVAKELGPEQAKAFDRYLNWSRAKNYAHITEVSGINNPTILNKNYLSTRLSPEGRERLGKALPEDEFDVPDDPGLKQRKRNFIRNPDPSNPNPSPRGQDYLPVLQTDLRRIMNNERIYQIAKAFGVRPPNKSVQPKEWLGLLEARLIERGVPKERAAYAVEQIKGHLIGNTRSPHLMLQGLNSVGYVGSLAGPKSALLNIHDPALGVVNFDVPLRELPGALKRAYGSAARKEGADVVESGIDQNVGEFTNKHIDMLNALGSKEEALRIWADTTREITNKGMKWSLFEATDTYSKNATLNLILEQLVREARDGTLANKWRFYMDPSDFSRVTNALKKHGTDWKAYKGKDFSLMEDLTFGALGQQQLISVAGRPSAWARNPNLRPLWALRGFAIQQQGLALHKTLRAFKEGRPEEAYNYLMKYAVIAGGSFGLINESRQWLFGDGEWELKGFLMGMADQVVSTASINTLGLNDYQFGRINEVGITQAWAESLVPIAFDIPYGIAGDVVDTLSGEQGPLYPITQFPLVKQPISFTNNMRDRLIDTVSSGSFGTVDIAPIVKDPQEEVMKRVGLIKDRSEN